MCFRGVLLAVLACFTVLSAAPSIASADSDLGGGPDENPDVATPQRPPADTRPASHSIVASPDVLAASAPRPFVDDFKYDELVLEGYAKDVCAGRLLSGSGWAFHEIVSRFGGTAGTMYYCRERWDTATNPDCNGQIANPSTNPYFYSTCWSNHAQGRAIDVMVGSQGGGFNTTRGINIVNWLLAADGYGSVNANARRLGIQQILFADRCWNSEGDRGITSWYAMRPCGIGHLDHVHMDLTLNGANGNVSYWGATPEVAGKHDTQVFWDQDSAWRQAVSWFNLGGRNEEGLAVPSQYDEILVGDLDRDGLEDETFLWDSETGTWALQNWNNGDSLTARIGDWGHGWEIIRIGDFDADGYLNEMLFWDRETGIYEVISWRDYTPWQASRGVFWSGWDGFYPADLDGNGMVNDLLLFDIETHLYYAVSWANLTPTLQRAAYFPLLGAQEIIVGDWSAGGDLDEVILWNRYSGYWLLYSFSAFVPTYQNVDRWNPAFDIAAPGDYDTDGRIDDIFLYATDSGVWAIVSFHRNAQTTRLYQSWGPGWDVISVGEFMN